MEQKTKFIIIGLIGLSLICLFLFVQTLNSKQMLLRQSQELKNENTALSSRVAEMETSLRDYENKISALNSDLDRVSQEKKDIEKKYESANKQKEELAEKLKSQQGRATVAPAEFVPQTADAYWAGILKAKTDLEMQLGSLRQELKSMQINNEQVMREKSTLDLDITGLRREKEDLQRQIAYNQKLIDSLAQELVREKNDKAQIQDTFKAVKNENNVLAQQVRVLNNHKINLEKKIEAIQEQKITVERRLNEIETMLIEKVSQIGDLKDRLDVIRSGVKVSPQQEKKGSVELAPIVVRPDTQAPAARSPDPGRSGKILSLNSDNNFVIINLGQQSGISVGDSFQIYRNGSPIADVEVIQTRQDIAACDIKKENTPVKVGDIVK